MNDELYKKCKEIVRSEKVSLMLPHQVFNPYAIQSPTITDNQPEIIFIDYLTPLKEPGDNNEK